MNLFLRFGNRGGRRAAQDRRANAGRSPGQGGQHRRAFLGSTGNAPRYRRLQLEPLESRALLSTVCLVTNTGDSGLGSLRQAILDANGASDGPVSVEFRIPVTDPGFVNMDEGLPFGDAEPDVFLIRPASPLPALDNPAWGITVDGRTQTAETGDTNPWGPEIVLNGRNVGTAGAGLEIRSGGNAVWGLNIQGFPNSGIQVWGNRNLIAGNYIGTDAAGLAAVGNGWDGINLYETSYVTLGGTAAGAGNVISGNQGSGVTVGGQEISVFQWAAADGGNDHWYILTPPKTWADAESAAAALGGHLLAVGSQAEQNFLDQYVFAGDAFSYEWFWTGLNDRDQEGQFVWTSGEPLSWENWYPGEPNGDVQENCVVINSGDDYPNHRGQWTDINSESLTRGIIELAALPDWTTGVTALGGGQNVIQGNRIGTDATGALPLGNGGSGIRIQFSPFNTIGGTEAGAGNVISGNAWEGIFVGDRRSVGNEILGNRIGTNAAGDAALANGGDGVSLNEVSGNLVGGADTGAGNIVSGNRGNGLSVNGDDIPVFSWPAEDGGNGHYYVLSPPSSWWRASQTAADWGGHLVSVNSAAEQEFLDEQLFAGDAFGYSSFWTGLHDHESEGVFEWTSGEPVTFENWDSGEPNGGLYENGVLINSGQDFPDHRGQWWDAPSQFYYSGIVELDHPPDWEAIRATLDARNNTIQGNLVGTDATGRLDLGNQRFGVFIQHAVENFVGGTAAGAGNVVSGNGQDGVQINGFTASRNVIQGNLIGTDASGTRPLDNDWSGVRLYRAPNNLVGGSESGAANVIAANERSGIEVWWPTAIGNQVLGNRIGTDVTGTVDLGNRQAGIGSWYASGTILGGAAAGAGNLISGNEWNGIQVYGDDFPVYHWAAKDGGNGHYYVVSAPPRAWQDAEDVARELGGHLAAVNSEAEQAFLEATLLADRFAWTAFWLGLTDRAQEGEFQWSSGEPVTYTNWQGGAPGTDLNASYVAMNANPGDPATRGTWSVQPRYQDWSNSALIELETALDEDVLFQILGTRGTVIQGNKIGTDVTGEVALGNRYNGVSINHSYNNTIGGAAAGAGNVISGNGIAGVGLWGARATQNVIQGNRLGTDGDGAAALGNTADGISIQYAPNNLIGGLDPAARNVISANGSEGISIGGGATSGNQILGNYIGTDATGTVDLGNRWRGIFTGASATVIGGTAPGTGNLISGNDDNGIMIVGDDYPVYHWASTDGGNDHYYVVAGSGRTWPEAAAVADALGGDLVAVNSEEEQAFIEATILADRFAFTSFWTGLTDRAGEGDFRWTSGEPVSYTNWAPGEPNGGIDESSVTLNALPYDPATRGTWSDQHGEWGNAALLEFAAAPSETLLRSVLGTGHAVIQGNKIGTDVTGEVALGNRYSGVLINHSYDNTIGGEQPGARNVISANGQRGIELWGLRASGNRIQGNYIGTDVDGDEALGNEAGIGIWYAPDNLIGGLDPAARNMISANQAEGIWIGHSSASGNQILGNYIGTDVNGTADLGNGGNGVNVYVASATVIGATQAAGGNLISGNGAQGINIGGYDFPVYHWPAADGGSGHWYVVVPPRTWREADAVAQALGGYVAAINDATEQAFVHTTILSDRFSTTTLWIGLTDRQQEGQFQWSNGEPLTYTNWQPGEPDGGLEHSFVVLNARPDDPAAKGTWSDAYSDWEYQALIEVEARPDEALLAQLVATRGTVIQGNKIGTDVHGEADLGNSQHGIAISQAREGRIGGVESGQGNVVSGNDQAGLEISGSMATGNVIQGNFVGTDGDGDEPLGNRWDGIEFRGAPGNLAGGSDPRARNVIAANQGSGIWIWGWSAAGNQVLGNKIGTDISGTVDLGNSGDGVFVGWASDTVIGGTAANAGNLVSGNEGHGIEIAGDDFPVYRWDVEQGGNGHWYVVTPGRTWPAADALARSLGGYLAAINSGEEQAFLHATLLADRFARETLWIGLTDAAVEGVFRWSNGEPVTYTNWRSGEPDGGVHYNHVAMNTHPGEAATKGKWSDQQGQWEQSALIEFESEPDAELLLVLLGTGHAVIQGNKVGTDGFGEFDLGNRDGGIQLSQTHSNTVGGTETRAGNLVSGNEAFGISLWGSRATRNVIQGNRIGTNRDGSGAIGNAWGGIGIDHAPRNLVGGSLPASRNLIAGNPGDGIWIYGWTATGNEIAGNYIGTDATGTLDLGNAGHGISSYLASGTVIGGTTGDSGNLISSNDGQGIALSGDDFPIYQWPVADGGNGHWYAVTQRPSWEAADAVAQALGGYLVAINTAPEQAFLYDTILADRYARDTIWVGLTDRAQEGTFVWSNGDPLTYTNWRPGEPDGGVDHNFVALNTHPGDVLTKGTWSDQPGNQWHLALIELEMLPDEALLFELLGAGRAVVQGNKIGTDVSGQAALGNDAAGIGIWQAYENMIGGAASGAGNLVSGNTEGIVLSGVRTTGNLVLGNYVGTNADGTRDLGNAWDGIRLDQASRNVVGGAETTAGNLVSGNGMGVEIQGRATVGNRLLGNRIGTDITGTQPLGNDGSGLLISEASQTVVGGSAAGEGNLISANVWGGVEIYGNDLPIFSWPEADGGNGHYYVIAPALTWLDAEITARSLGGYLVAIGSLAEQGFIETTVLAGGYRGQSLYIGLTDRHTEGEFVWTNGEPLVYEHWRDGEPDGGLIRNHVVLNLYPSVPETWATWSDDYGDSQRRSLFEFDGPPDEERLRALFGTWGLTMLGNAIGTDAAGQLDLGNGGDGLFLYNVASSRVGGLDASEANTIAFNRWNGVAIAGDATVGNWLRGNAIAANGELGIDLGWDGVTLNDPGDADGGANESQNFPLITSLQKGITTRVAGILDSRPNTTYALDFYASATADPSGYGEGARYLGSATVSTDDAGHADFDTVLTAATSGSETVAATATDPTGNTSEFSAADTGTLIVTRFVPTDSGFMAWFSRDLEPSVLNLYDGAGGTLGPPDVTVRDGASNRLAGSLVMSADRRQITFVQTGGLLKPDAYTVTLVSGDMRFREPAGGTLDGNADGTPGDDYRTTFTVWPRPAGTVAISLPDFARGAGQSVNIPNTASGLPIRLDHAEGVTSLAVDLWYDPALLSITGATLASGIPAGWSVGLDTSTPGVARIWASGTTPLSGTNVEVVRLRAAVPNTAPYGAIQAVPLENVSLNGGAIAAVGDVAVHKAVYLGDADGSGIHSSADAFLTVQAALGLASGYAAHAWTDPRIVGDCDSSGVLSAADAFLIVQEGLGLSEPFVPDNPHITVTPVGGGVDPQFQIGADLVPDADGWVSVPVNLAIEPAATNVGAFEFDLFFDPARLTIQVPGGVSAGADTAERWAVSATLVSAGHLRVGMVTSSGQPLVPGLREIVRLLFRVEAGESSRTGWQSVPDGLPTRPTLLPPITDHRLPIADVSDGSETQPTWLDIQPVDASAGGYTWTDADGSVLIRPAQHALAAAARERIWRDVDAKAELLESVLADLVHEIDSA